jgi:6-phosphogluconolactonase
MPWIEHDYPDTAALADGLCVALRATCENALHERGEALLSLAGGRTPLPAYRALAADDTLDWSKVVLMPGDDRCVLHDHAASNVAALHDAFSAAHGVRIEALTTVDGDPVASLTHARRMLARYAMPFDAVVLGMAEDAHEDAFALTPDPLPPEAPFARITLGYARLLRARSLHVLVTGSRKREVLRAAQATRDPIGMPISAFLHAPSLDTHGRALHIHWSP